VKNGKSYLLPASEIAASVSAGLYYSVEVLALVLR